MVFDQAQLERPCRVQPVDADEIDAGVRRAGCEAGFMTGADSGS